MILNKTLPARHFLGLCAAVLMLQAAPAFAEGAAAKSEFEYYQVPPVTVPVVTDKGVTQQVSLAISLELPTGKKDEIAAYGPRLVDAYLSDLFAALGNGQVMMKGNLVDIEAIKLRLTNVTARVVGPEKKENIKAVLLQAVQQNRVL